jgi:hypothetical protein
VKKIIWARFLPKSARPATDCRRHVAMLRVSLLVRTVRRELRLRDEFPFRLHTASQFRRLPRAVPCLELCDVYDFWYEIDHPLRLDNVISDAVFILRKRARRAARRPCRPRQA